LRALRNLARVSLAVVMVFVLGTAGFHFIEGWGWFDSFYSVLITVSTIGTEVHPLSHVGRLFNVAVIILGVGLVFLAIGALTQALLEFELRNFFGRRRMQREVDRLQDHYIICGAGRVGRSAARELARRGATFVFVESAAEKLTRLPPEWRVLQGDATHESMLQQAHIERARGLVAAATTDATNLYIVLTARALNPGLKIIARASEDEAEKYLKSAGADTVISPYHFTGHRIAQSFLRPNVLDFIDSATVHIGVDLEIAEVEVRPGSRFVGQSFRDSRVRADMGVIVLAFKREGRMKFNPLPDDRMQAGDFLIAMGEPAGLRKLEEAATAVSK
jgi:voltage-gated potassium channel